MLAARRLLFCHCARGFPSLAATGPSFFSAKKEAKNSSLGYSATVGSASTCKPQNLLGDISSCTEGCYPQPYGTILGAGTGLGGVWQLPAATPSHPDIKATAGAYAGKRIQEAKGWHMRGAAWIRAGWMATGSNRSRQALIFLLRFFIKKKMKACPARARKSLRGSSAKSKSRSATKGPHGLTCTI